MLNAHCEAANDNGVEVYKCTMYTNGNMLAMTYALPGGECTEEEIFCTLADWAQVVLSRALKLCLRSVRTIMMTMTTTMMMTMIAPKPLSTKVRLVCDAVALCAC